MTLVWAVLMLVEKTGVLERAPATVQAVLHAVAAPIMIPAYIVGSAWLGVGTLLGFQATVPVWFEVLGVLVVGAAYVAVDRAIRGLVSRPPG